MDALTLLQTRNSASRLTDPAPDELALAQMLKAALRAPDHALLRPWRFLTVTGVAREALGALFVDAAQRRLAARGEPALTVEAGDKIAAKALRAPLIIVVIACIKPHPKVPAVEQLLSAGCAAHSILLAAQAQGFGAIWRTGDNTYDTHVKAGLGLEKEEEIVGFLYLGTVDGGLKPLRELAVVDFAVDWQGPK